MKGPTALLSSTRKPAGRHSFLSVHTAVPTLSFDTNESHDISGDAGGTVAWRLDI